MNAMISAPLVFFHLLANRKGVPAGLLFDGPWPGAEAALPDDEGWRALGVAVPCFYRADTAPGLSASLQECGWRVLPADSLLRTDAPFEQELAPAIRWVAGDWCLAPPAKAPGHHAASRALALQLVQRVAADADTHEIEALLRQDPTLSYHLLRLVNSLGLGAGRRVTTFGQAILILGRQQLRRWLNLMLFAAREGDVRSTMLLARVARRARAMESLARAGGMDKLSQEHAFMTGMFSLLGVLFGLPLDEVLQPLMISEAVQAALLSRGGELGALLALVEAAERGEHEAVCAQMQALQLAPADVSHIMVDASLWMLDVVKESSGHAA